MARPISDEERELMRQWVENWKQVGPVLEEMRRREIENADTQEAVRRLFGERSGFPHVEKRTTSGLVEQQAWFAKLRRQRGNTTTVSSA